MNPRHDALDWILLLTLVAMWGSSFFFIEIALRSVTPLVLVTIRIVLGAVLLQVLQNLVNLLGIPSSLNFAVMGSVILIGVLADQQFDRYRRRRAASVVVQEGTGEAKASA